MVPFGRILPARETDGWQAGSMMGFPYLYKPWDEPNDFIQSFC